MITVVAGGSFLSFITAINEKQVFSDKVIKTNEPLLWGPAFGQQHATYKLARSIYVKPEIIVLGSSRVTQFRDYLAPGTLKFTMLPWQRPVLVMLIVTLTV